MAASASGGGDAGPSTAQQKVDSKILWHFGLMPTDGSASSGGVVTRVLHVDAREDRLVEITDARISRIIALDDLVSYDEEEDEDADEDMSFVDEEEAATRTRERATVSLRVRRGAPFVSEVEDIEYRLQSVLDARALRVVLARLSRGHRTAEDETAEVSADANVPGLDARTLRAGTLMRRVGRVALSNVESGQWTTCLALCVPGKLILLAKQPNFDERPGDAGDGTKIPKPAPAVATGGRASPLAIHFAASLEDARVVSRAPRWNAGGGGEFDLVFNGEARARRAERRAPRARRLGGRCVAPRRGAETPTRDFLRDDVSSPKPFSFSAALDSATRATLAEAKRVAGAMRLDFGDARSVTEDARLGDASAADPPERVLVLDRFWRSAALGVGAHFLFNFSAEVVPETDKRGGVPGGANGRARRRKRRVLLHVDVERDAVEAYVDPRVRGRGRDRGWGLGMGRSRPAVTRSVETKDVATEASGPRELTLRAAGFGSFPRGAVFGRFAFQTAADREVFASLVRDLRRGAYRSADHYQYRAPLKRGAETGVSKTESDVAPARFLVLVPGKLLVLRGDRAGVPLATASLTEGAEVTALERTKRNAEGSDVQNSGSEPEGKNASNASLARAVVTLTLPNGDAFAFARDARRGEIVGARARRGAVEPVAEDAAGNANAFARAFERGRRRLPRIGGTGKSARFRSGSDSPNRRSRRRALPRRRRAVPPATPREAGAPAAARRARREAPVVDAATGRTPREVSEEQRRFSSSRPAAAAPRRVRGVVRAGGARARRVGDGVRRAGGVRARRARGRGARRPAEAAGAARPGEPIPAAKQARWRRLGSRRLLRGEGGGGSGPRVGGGAGGGGGAGRGRARLAPRRRRRLRRATRRRSRGGRSRAGRVGARGDRAQDEEDAVRRVQSENEFRLAVRARRGEEVRERAALGAREKTRAARGGARARGRGEQGAEHERAARASRVSPRRREAQRAERSASRGWPRSGRAADAEQAAARAARAAARPSGDAAGRRRAGGRRAGEAEDRCGVAGEGDVACVRTLAAEVAAAVMAGVDPFAATRANSVASPESAPTAARPRAAALARTARGGSPEAPPYAASVSDSADTPLPRRARGRQQRAGCTTRRMVDRSSRSARSEPAGPPSPPRLPSRRLDRGPLRARGEAGQAPRSPARAAGSGLGAREHPEDDVGAEDGVGPRRRRAAARRTGTGARPPRRAHPTRRRPRGRLPDRGGGHSHPGYRSARKSRLPWSARRCTTWRTPSRPRLRPTSPWWAPRWAGARAGARRRARRRR